MAIPVKKVAMKASVMAFVSAAADAAAFSARRPASAYVRFGFLSGAAGLILKRR